MKKIVEATSLLIMGFLYLMIVSQVFLTNVKLMLAIKLLLYFSSIIMSVYCVIIICNASRYKVNNRASFIAISSCLLNICLIVIIVLDIGFRGDSEKMGILCMCLFILEIGQLSSIFTALLPITTGKGYIKKCLMLLAGEILFWCLVADVFRYFPQNNQAYCVGKSLYIICIIGMGYFFRDQFNKNEKQYFAYAVIIKMIGTIVKINFIHLSLEVMIMVLNILQCLYFIVLLVFISDMINGELWKEISLDLKTKEDKVLQGFNERRRLEMATKVIDCSINEMSHSMKEVAARMKDDTRGLMYLYKIEDNCKRLERLNHNIVLLSQLEDKNLQTEMLQFQKIDIAKLVYETVNSLEPYVQEKKMHMTLKLSDHIEAEIDPQAIERTLINLISNAVKYNKTNGFIDVNLVGKKNFIFLSVKDTGIGMSEENMQVAFERFERMKHQTMQEGSGLGLAIVKALVAKHQGEIHIKSKVDIGTIISIKLPKRHIQSQEN